MEAIHDLKGRVIAWLDTTRDRVCDREQRVIGRVEDGWLYDGRGRHIGWYRDGVFWAPDGVIGWIDVPAGELRVAPAGESRVAPFRRSGRRLAGHFSSLSFGDAA